ncbi:MAG TPA: MFS transporter [Vicinamibacterales bacterium]
MSAPARALVTSAPAGEARAAYLGWRVTAASAVGVFVGFASLFVYTFALFLKPLADEFGWSRQDVSAAFGFAAISLALCSPLLGYLLDRFGPVRVIVPCVAIFGLAFASLSLLTPRLWHLYAVSIVLGCVGNGTAQMAYSRAVSSWFDARRGMALAVMMCGGATGALLLPPLTQRLIGSIGWRSAYATLGLAVVAIGVPVVLLFIRERPRPSGVRHTAETGATTIEGLCSFVFWVLVVVLFAASIAQNGAIAHLAALLTDRGVTEEGAALALSTMGGASLAGRLVTGWLLDRFFAARVSFALLVLAAAGVLLLAHAHTLAAGVVAAALIGFGMGGEADVIPYLLTRYFGLRSFATLYGFTWTAYACAGAIGPVLMGRAFDLTASYESLLTFLAAGTALAGALMLVLPRYSTPTPLIRRDRD